MSLLVHCSFGSFLQLLRRHILLVRRDRPVIAELVLHLRKSVSQNTSIGSAEVYTAVQMFFAGTRFFALISG